MNCYECGLSADHQHHVIPKLLGGTKTIPLCSKCHGKVHKIGNMYTSALTKAGLEAAVKRGVKLGRPLKLTPEKFFKVLSLRSHGFTYVEIKNQLGVDKQQVNNSLNNNKYRANFIK